jgi:hypothetical protein
VSIWEWIKAAGFLLGGLLLGGLLGLGLLQVVLWLAYDPPV